MKRVVVWLGILLLPMAVSAYAGGEIYGTIYTDRGEEFTGPIRWDKNENFWDDILDANKRDKVYVEGRGSRIKIFGLVFNSDGGGWRSTELNLPFGDIESIESRGGDRVVIRLKNGERLKIEASGTDIGSGMRGLTITDKNEGEIDLEWNDVDEIKFSSGPGPGLDDERLYGTVVTDGGTFTGFIVWDRDESLKPDILDGDDDGRRRKIPFGSIRTIERRGHSGCRVTLTNGDEMFLEGTNDVDSGNRGIDITIPGMGVVKVDWEDFDEVTFAEPPPSKRYEEFDGGKPIKGTVRDEDGRSYSGTIVWDADEEWDWEVIDGEYDDIDYEIPFLNIKTIKRDSRRSAQIILRNGESLILRGSNDVDRDNRGIRITSPDGDETELDWYEFESAEIEQ